MEKRYESCSVTPATVTEVQKERIIEAILASVASMPYYKGLEEEICKAVSFINKYSDREMEETTVTIG